MNLPNKLTIFRIILVPIFVAVYYLPWVYAPVVAIAIYILASFTDFLDGYIARKYNLVTDFGKLMDPIADKILVVTALFLIVESNVLPIAFASSCSALIVAREFIIAGVRQVASSKGIVIQANVYGKIKMVVQTVAIPICLLLKLGTLLGGFEQIVLMISIITLSLATLLTIISGIVYLIQNRKVFSD